MKNQYIGRDCIKRRKGGGGGRGVRQFVSFELRGLLEFSES